MMKKITTLGDLLQYILDLGIEPDDVPVFVAQATRNGFSTPTHPVVVTTGRGEVILVGNTEQEIYRE